jgi:predicted phosphodiesterase
MRSTSKGAQRFIVVSDNHGDMADAASVGALWSFIREWKPEIRIHAGDNYDFRNLRKGASDEEKAASLADDWEAGNDFMRRFFEGGTSNHFLRGNHDERIYDFRSNSTGIIRDYAHDGIKQLEATVKKCRAKMLPYDSDLGVLELGKLSVIHGYHAGASACRQHANIYRNCIFGHVHTIESAPVPSREPAEARSIGCLCKRDMDYINKKTGKLRWAQGWAYGLLFPNGTYQLFQTRNLNGNFYAATEIKIFSA